MVGGLFPQQVLEDPRTRGGPEEDPRTQGGPEEDPRRT